MKSKYAVYPLLAASLSSLAGQQQPIVAGVNPKDSLHPAVSISAPEQLKSGFVTHLHELSSPKSVDSRPITQSIGQFVLSANPLDLAEHKNTPLRFWKEPAGYRLEGIFTAKEEGWHTIVTELSCPPLRLYFGKKKKKKVKSSMAFEYRFSIDGVDYLTSSLRNGQKKRLTAEDFNCGFSEQKAFSRYLFPGHYKVVIWFAAQGRRHLKPKWPKIYHAPDSCPNAGQKIRADSNPADEIKLEIFIRRPGEHSPKPAVPSDFAHLKAEQS